MSVLWHHGVRTGKLTPNEFVKVTSTNCAQIFNIHPKKGDIKVGSDADIIVWDPEGTRLIPAETHHQNIDFNIYEGLEVTGIPVVTLSRGRILWKDGDLRTVKGTGKYFDRPCFPSYFDAVNRVRELSQPLPVDRD